MLKKVYKTLKKLAMVDPKMSTTNMFYLNEANYSNSLRPDTKCENVFQIIQAQITLKRLYGLVH